MIRREETREGCPWQKRLKDGDLLGVTRIGREEAVREVNWDVKSVFGGEDSSS